MPLLSFWASNPEAGGQLTIEQIVASAGDGVIKDKSVCSAELRSYLQQVATEKIQIYVEHCLNTSFNKSGQVLQDLINELGRRLDYEVTDGLYSGVSNAIGFDGIWLSPDKHALIIEVKTTDAYRLSLDTLATYRAKLQNSAVIGSASSILIVVGRQDTGELEAQIRGSRHAWDIRVISAEALIKLVFLKQNAEAPETALKIRSLFIPVEYTRLDRMVDVMFTTVSDVEPQPAVDDEMPQVAPPSHHGSGSDKTVWQFTDSGVLQDKRELILAALSGREHAPLVKKSRALYGNELQGVHVACGMSKMYAGANRYWYAFHPQWESYLQETSKSYYVLGCMDRNVAYAIPYEVLKPFLPKLNTTTNSKGNTYWHIHLRETEGGKLTLNVPYASGLELEPYQLIFNE